ncbi:MAG TPA: outer membrane protein transport protein [Pirellulales bacterium]|nr:outer membrane protein transport protein [Pirellulales bacterium]
MRFSALRLLITSASVFVSAAGAALAQGIALPAAGPINQSMGGAAVAAPIDAMGALYWNPASISGLSCSEMGFGLGLLLPTTHLSSSLAANSLGPGFPPVTLAGSNKSNAGVCAIPDLGIVQKLDDSDWTYGLGVIAAGGFSTNYPASATNPVLTPPPPAGLGLGHTYAHLEVLQIIPTLAYQLTDRWSVGVGPTVDIARLELDPAIFAAPDDANGDGFFSYPSGTATSYNWGLGAQFGLFYKAPEWNLGFSLKTPQWFDDFRANSSDEIGQPRTVKSEFDFPMIASWGIAYTGWERWLVALDLRYFDYRNTDGFRTAAFNADGSVTGLGWKNVFALATGVQYQVNDCWFLRMGYSYNENPISNDVAFFNAASPLVTQHLISIGTSFRASSHCLWSVSYTHAFENSVTGPIVTQLGPIPGSSVTNTTSADMLYAGISVYF